MSPEEQPIAVIAAHPDDETIGVGAQLPEWKRVHLIHITDGAPRHGDDASRNGFHTREAYAQARRNELIAAMTVAGVPADRLCWAGFVDQEASLDLVGLTHRLAGMFESLQPDVVITHPYEGGHPDHDATTFAVHAACALLGGTAPRIQEFTSYHSRGGAMGVGEFLGEDQGNQLCLSASQQQRKQLMFDCFATQQQVLSLFPVEKERLRRAPRYDFRVPPHQGVLFYEQFSWGMDGERWRKLAGNALKLLGIESRL